VPMAFPSNRSIATTNGTSASTTPVVTLPATINAGDTIFVVFRSAVAGAVGWPDATWTELFDASPDGADDQMAAAWKKATGTEGGTTITLSSGNGKFCAYAAAILDAADPTVLPPELSTAATGTTPNQPDATTCTPTGGSKDYLWTTFFGMEGEQTGITTYPTNYTLNQSGLANSGTGGLTSTNVTMAAASRQATAASEDAGVWAVAGTLINWTAYTIAFHPALPVVPDRFTDQHLPTRFPRPSHSLLALTLAVNLLQSTLAPVAAVPNNQEDWPNPRIGAAHKVGFTQARPQYYVDQYPPIAQHHWPTPPRLPRLITTIGVYPSSDTVLPTITHVVGMRAQPRPPLIPDLPSLLLTTLAPTTSVPNQQSEWPTPARLKPQTGGWLQPRPQDYQDQTAVGAALYPDALAKPSLRLNGWTFDRPQYYVDTGIQRQSDWPNPAPKPALRLNGWTQDLVRWMPPIGVQQQPDRIAPLRRLPESWQQDRPQYYVDQTAVGATSAPDFLPKPTLRLNGWTQDRPAYYIEPLPVGAAAYPGRIAPLRPAGLTWQNDRPTYYQDQAAVGRTTVPDRFPRALSPTLDPLNLLTTTLAVTTAPGLPQDWALSRVGRRHTLTWSQDRPPYYTDATAVGASSLPLPRSRALAPRFDALNLLTTTLAPQVTPPIVVDWSTPRRLRALALTWTQDRPPYYTDASAVGAAFYPSRVARLAGLPSSDPPNLLTTVLRQGAAPVVPVDWPLPRRRVSLTQTAGWMYARPSFYPDAAGHNNLQPYIAVYHWYRIA